MIDTIPLSNHQERERPNQSNFMFSYSANLPQSPANLPQSPANLPQSPANLPSDRLWLRVSYCPGWQVISPPPQRQLVALNVSVISTSVCPVHQKIENQLKFAAGLIILQPVWQLQPGL